MTRVLVVVLVLFSLVFTLEAQTTKKWTILVYLDGDNNLEGDGINDVNEMEQVGSDANVNIVVQFDRIPGYDTSNGDWTGTRRYYVTNDTDTSVINSTMISDLGEKNMGAEATFTEFLRWGMTNYPAERYFVILWNHGGGWRSKSAPDQNKKTSLVKGVCWDDTDGSDYLTMAEVNSSINTIANEFSHPINIVGFDACIMGLAEVAYMVKGPTAYPTETVIFSQANEPGAGWDYAHFLPGFVDTPNDPTLSLATHVVDAFYDYYNGSSNTTLSVVDMTKMSAFLTSLSAFANGVSGEWNILQSAITSSQSFNYDAYRDLTHITDYCRKNFYSSSYKSLADDLYTKTQDFVTYYKNTGSFATSKGLNIYFPLNSSDSEWSAYTTSNAFMLNDAPWRTFLSTYFAADKTPPATPATPSVTSETPNYRVSWDSVADASGYHLRERIILSNLLDSNFDDATMGDWSAYAGTGYSAFSLQNTDYHSSSYAIFSGNTHSLKSGVQSKLLSIPNDANEYTLSLWVNYKTESGFDYFFIDVYDGTILTNLSSYSGDSSGWTQLSFNLDEFKGKDIRVVLRFVTDTSVIIDNGGVWVDDISVDTQKSVLRTISGATNALITENLDGTYLYAVASYDASGNVSSFSEEYEYSHSTVPTIIVTAPNGSERLLRGSNYTITWNDNIADNVKIDLYKNSIFASTIASSTESDGSYVWAVPADIAIGSDYRIVITSVADAGLSDQSNADFIIADANITASIAVNGAIWGYTSVYVASDVEIPSAWITILYDTNVTTYGVDMMGTGGRYFRSVNAFNTIHFSDGAHTIYVRRNGTTVQTLSLTAASIYPSSTVRFNGLALNIKEGNGGMMVVEGDVKISTCPISTTNKPFTIAFENASTKRIEIANPYGNKGALLRYDNNSWILVDHSVDNLVIRKAGTYVVVNDVNNVMIPVIRSNELAQNYPNPFNPSTEIPVKLVESSDIVLTVFDAKGREVIVLAEGRYEAGLTRIPWNGRDKRGNEVPSGVYYYRLTVNGKSFTKKMIMLK